MKKMIFAVLTITLLLNTAGCTKSSTEEKTDIRGQITKVLTDENKAVTGIMVEGKVESDTVHDKAMVRMNKGTKITARDTGEKLSANDLKEGIKVEVVFDGPILESYPVQANAKSVKVIEESLQE